MTAWTSVAAEFSGCGVFTFTSVCSVLVSMPILIIIREDAPLVYFTYRVTVFARIPGERYDWGFVSVLLRRISSTD